MKEITIVIFLAILFVGCSSTQKSLRDAEYDKRKVLFIVNYTYDRYPYAKTLIDDFVAEFKNNLLVSFIEPSDFLYFKSTGIPSNDYKSEAFKNGYLNYYNSVYDDDKLLKYYPDDIIFLTFYFKYSQWNNPEKINSVDLFIFNTTTRNMSKISVEKSLFSNLTNKVTDNLLESHIITAPKYNHKVILVKKLIEIDKDINNLNTKNEYGSLKQFEKSINEINVVKERLSVIDTLARNLEFQVKLDSLNNKIYNKIFDAYINYSENQIDRETTIKRYKELLENYKRNLTIQQLEIIQNKLQNFNNTYPSVSLVVQGWPKINNSNLQKFSDLLSERVQNIWHQKDTILYIFQYENTRPAELIIEYRAMEFPFSFINIDNTNYSILDDTGVKLLLNLLDNFTLYNNYVPELTYDLDKFLGNLTIYYNDSQNRSVSLYCFAYGNSYDGLFIIVSEVGYKQKSWSTYKLIKSNSNLAAAISFTTFEKDFLKFLSIK